jgi:hypothetical protein
MTTVLAAANMPSSAVDTSVRPLDQTKIKFKGSALLADGYTREATYVYFDGDPTVDTLVTIRHGVTPKTGRMSVSVKLSTIQTVTVDSLLTETAPISVSVTWDNPGISEDPSVILKMIGTAFSLWYDGLTTKEPKTGVISLLNKGLIEGVYTS